MGSGAPVKAGARGNSSFFLPPRGPSFSCLSEAGPTRSVIRPASRPSPSSHPQLALPNPVSLRGRHSGCPLSPPPPWVPSGGWTQSLGGRPREALSFSVAPVTNAIHAATSNHTHWSARRPGGQKAGRAQLGSVLRAPRGWDPDASRPESDLAALGNYLLSSSGDWNAVLGGSKTLSPSPCPLLSRVQGSLPLSG